MMIKDSSISNVEAGGPAKISGWWFHEGATNAGILFRVIENNIKTNKSSAFIKYPQIIMLSIKQKFHRSKASFKYQIFISFGIWYYQCSADGSWHQLAPTTWTINSHTVQLGQ